jgi:hypothetical protein
MNRSKMTTEELLQLAGADLLGILEDEERQRFEQAFLEATPAVQETIRREQAQAAESLLATLPHADPPMRMRQEVLEQVLAASGQESTLRLAGVGPRQDGVAPTHATAAPERNDETHWRDAVAQVGVSRYWRAACLALIGLSLALGALYRDAKVSVDTLAHVLKKESWATHQNRIVRLAGVPYSELHIHPETVTVRFRSESQGDLWAALDYNERLGQAFLELRGLEEGQQFELCYVVDEAEEYPYRRRLTYEDQILPVEFAAVNLPANGRWEIRAAGSDEALLVAVA